MYIYIRYIYYIYIYYIYIIHIHLYLPVLERLRSTSSWVTPGMRQHPLEPRGGTGPEDLWGLDQLVHWDFSIPWEKRMDPLVEMV